MKRNKQRTIQKRNQRKNIRVYKIQNGFISEQLIIKGEKSKDETGGYHTDFSFYVFCLIPTERKPINWYTAIDMKIQDISLDEYSFMQFHYNTPPMDLMMMNHELEIQRMMGVPGVVMMNYVLDESPYNPITW